jgi:hypothetical protein
VSIAVTIVARGEDELVAAQLAFHLAAGAENVLVAPGGAVASPPAVLEHHREDARVHVVSEPADGEAEKRTMMARRAATELGSAWVVHARPGEFWWPRSTSVADALAAVPPRYTIVQGLVRRFLPSSGDGRPRTQLTVRDALAQPGAEPPPLSRTLRRLHRALPDVVVGADGEPVGRGHVPLRAWYPFEVLTLPSDEAGEQLGDEEVERGLAAGSLAQDTRLADALAAIQAGGVPALGVPDIVEEAAYAVECAAVGEVDTTRLVAHLDELEARLAQLEQGFRARVIRRLSRLAGGGRRDGH